MFSSGIDRLDALHRIADRGQSDGMKHCGFELNDRWLPTFLRRILLPVENTRVCLRFGPVESLNYNFGVSATKSNVS